MTSVTRKKVRILLAVRAETEKQIAPANPLGSMEIPLGVKKRKFVMM